MKHIRSATVIYTRSFAIHNVESASRAAGVSFQVHNTTTADGYKLTLHRLHGKVNDPNSNYSHSTPILLQHGLWASSDDWVVCGPEKSLCFHLCETGFDVWLGNTRGNLYSKEHLQLPTTDTKFWDFSWHEMGVFDLPASIDYITKVTKRKQIYYIGHSQGTTAFFVMTATKPSYNKKVRAMFAFAPIVYIHNLRNSFLRQVSSISDVIWKVLQAAGVVHILPDERFVQIVDKWWKSTPNVSSMLVNFLTQDLSHYATQEVRTNLHDVILSHMKTGTPLKSLVHYSQCLNKKGCFRMFDYGPEKNKVIYKQRNPPSYDFDNISVPIVAFWSEADWLTSREDVEAFHQELFKNLIIEEVTAPKFNHQDFMWADINQFGIVNKLLKYLFIYGKITP